MFEHTDHGGLLDGIVVDIELAAVLDGCRRSSLTSATIFCSNGKESGP